MAITPDLLKKIRERSKGVPQAQKVEEKIEEPVDPDVEVKEIKDDKGTLLQTITFRKGVMDGPYTVFYASGKPKQITHYKDDVLEGPLQYFNELEELVYEANFEGGKMQGTAKQYTHGRLTAEYEFVNGKQEGPAKFYKDGRLAAELSYKQGKMEGLFKAYREGNLAKECHYKMGKLEGASIVYYPDGAVLQTMTYVNALVEGEEKKFYQDGTLMEQTLFEKGEPKIKQSFDTKGVLTEEKKFE